MTPGSANNNPRATLYLGMAKAEIGVILALRETASRLGKSDRYQWGHMGHCNCGFLAQVVTGKTPADIHAAAMLGHGDWNEQLTDYCPSTGLAMESVIGQLLEIGFDRDDLAHLERLSDPKILQLLPGCGSTLRHNCKQDVLSYLQACAKLLEDRWAIQQPGIKTQQFSDVAVAAEREYNLSPGSLG